MNEIMDEDRNMSCHATKIKSSYRTFYFQDGRENLETAGMRL